MTNNLPAVRSSSSLVAPAGTHGPVIARRSSGIRQLACTARSAAELVMTAADAVADRVLELVSAPRH